MVDSDWWGYRIRADAANEFLRGHGMEIGAGASPHRLPPEATSLYFDKSDKARLSKQFGMEINYNVLPMQRVRSKFPHGADFLIAHNVLEHTPSEIATLIEWHQYVRRGGIVVLSMPLKGYTLGDQRRLGAPLLHLLEDYLFHRDDKSFESREHSYAFCLNWDASGWSPYWRDLSRDGFVNHLLEQAHAEVMDIHWHALDREQWDFVIAAAALFGRKSIRLLRCVLPSTAIATQGEAIYVYEVSEGSDHQGFPDIRPDLKIAFERYSTAHSAIRAALEFAE